LLDELNWRPHLVAAVAASAQDSSALLYCVGKPDIWFFGDFTSTVTAYQR